MNRISFSELSTPEKLLLAGNSMAVVGACLCSLGALLKMLDEGSLPTHPNVAPDYQSNGEKRRTSAYAGRTSCTGFFKS